jgi:GH15 family glucan-1,4-alpha-glucosidase
VGLGIEDDIVKTSHEFLDQTTKHWRTWVKHCSIPVLYQEEVIRSALVLKLHCYEDTGAILAAVTSSLPEQPGGGRSWDYRYCWLRDAYFSLSAFHNLGHFEEMEGFLKFLLNIAYTLDQSQDRLSPVYSLSQDLPIPEAEHQNWEGFAHSRPVRSRNQGAEHVQNDVYGEMILTLPPIFSTIDSTICARRNTKSWWRSCSTSACGEFPSLMPACGRSATGGRNIPSPT